MFYPSQVVLHTTLVLCWQTQDPSHAQGKWEHPSSVPAQGTSLSSRSHHIILSRATEAKSRHLSLSCLCRSSPPMPAQPWWSYLSVLSPWEPIRGALLNPNLVLDLPLQATQVTPVLAVGEGALWGGRNRADGPEGGLWGHRALLGSAKSPISPSASSSLVFHKGRRLT